MKTTTTALRLSLVALFGTAAVAAQAQGSTAAGYVMDARGAPVTSGAGLCWRTGYWSPAMASAECDADLLPRAPAPAAQAPAAPARPAPAAAPVAPKKCDFSYTLKNDETFPFNKATLERAARVRLDSDVVAKLGNCAQVRAIVVTGHSDRLGTSLYNQRLSEKRADAVKAYLVSKGVNADAIETLGAGKTQPVPGVKCDDALKRQALIQCLAPNRRVVIEVMGTAR